MNDRDRVRINLGGAGEESQRRQRLEIRRIAVEVDIVRGTHRYSSMTFGPLLSLAANGGLKRVFIC